MELKRGDRAREFIALTFPFSSKLKNLVISRRSCAGAAKKCTKKRDARAELLSVLINPVAFLTFC